MLNLLQSASDDQVALLGCAVALMAAGAVMYLSFYVGPAHRRDVAARRSRPALSLQPVRQAEDRAA